MSVIAIYHQLTRKAREVARHSHACFRSGNSNFDVEASAVIAHDPIVDAQEESPSFSDVQAYALTDEKELARLDANPGRILGAIDRLEAPRVLNSRLGNKGAD